MIDSNPSSWTCKRCRALVVTDEVATNGKTEIKYCSFRKDLGKEKLRNYHDVMQSCSIDRQL